VIYPPGTNRNSQFAIHKSSDGRDEERVEIGVDGRDRRRQVEKGHQQRAPQRERGAHRNVIEAGDERDRREHAARAPHASDDHMKPYGLGFSAPR
jgi:hypothetical protein